MQLSGFSSRHSAACRTLKMLFQVSKLTTVICLFMNIHWLTLKDRAQCRSRRCRLNAVIRSIARSLIRCSHGGTVRRTSGRQYHRVNTFCRVLCSIRDILRVGFPGSSAGRYFHVNASSDRPADSPTISG
jgi:hypothetical protein